MITDTMRTALANSAAIVILSLAASCGMVECDAAKRESIKLSNSGVEKVRLQAPNDAIKDFQRAIELDPENHQAAYNLGQVLVNQADGACRANNEKDCQDFWTKAADAFEVAAKGDPEDAMYQYRMGQALYEARKYDQARTALEKALSLNKKLFKAYWFLGKVHDAQARPREAAEAWTASAKLNPGFGKPFIDLGKLYYQWDEIDAAIKVLEAGAATAMDPTDRSAINYQLGLCYDMQQQWPKAIAAYEKSLAEEQGNLDAKLQLAFSLANNGDKPRALKLLEEYTRSIGKEANAAKLTAANAMKFKLMQTQQ
jgi:Tfp pilus assembly protein PilF